MFKPLVMLLLMVTHATGLQAEEVIVAVAANFLSPMQQIAASFKKDTGHQLKLSAGSSGGFYAQIKNGSPFEVFLSADQMTPQKLEVEGLGLPNTRLTYAVGQLVLWSQQDGLVDQNGVVLSSNAVQRIAIANPKLAPYGAAAEETLKHLGKWESLQSKLVQGENIAQTYQFVETQNAQLGFVALSQVFRNGKITSGSAWIVPPNLYRPIKQDAILLKRGQNNVGAKALMNYLRSDQARQIIKSYGYITEKKE